MLLFIFNKKVHAVIDVNVINYPQQVSTDEEFDVTFNIISDTLSSDSYYIKGRIGSTSASLIKGWTLDSITNNWLSDNTAWANFPLMNFNKSNISTGSVKLKTDSSAYIGENLLTLRVNINGKNYDSSFSKLLVNEPQPTLTPSITPTPTPTITIASPEPILYDNIFISEVMVNPESGKNEWIELYNDNNFDVSLAGWYFDDLENAGSSPKMFSLNVSSKSFRVYNLTSSIFNNEGDSVRLLDFNKNLRDEFEYGMSTPGKSFGRISFESNDFCIQESSYEMSNKACLNPDISPTNVLLPSPVLTPIKTSLVNSQQPKKILSKNPLPLSPTQSVLNNSQVEILGASTKINKDALKIQLLSFISLSYSLLTIASILIKMKIIYGKVEKLLSSFIYTSRAQQL